MALDFVFAYPALLFDAFGLSLCAMFGQQVIYYIIKVRFVLSLLY